MVEQFKFDEALASSEHRELHHYTDWNGLRGIYKSGRIWATHYTSLNDFTEVTLLKKHVMPILRARLTEYIRQNKVERNELRNAIQNVGSVAGAGRELARAVIDTAYEITFEGFRGPAFASPFIASFCSHARDHRYERENGLLSQWRAYGGAERYALVFDTKAVEKLLEQEHRTFQYKITTIFDVKYSDSIEDLNEWLRPLNEELFKVAKALMFEKHESFDNLYALFVTAATRLKHQGFKEEREVRIVANPNTKELEDYLRSQSSEEIDKDTRSRKVIKQTHSGRQYIELFGLGRAAGLPIKRILVGPHKEIERHVAKVRTLVKNKVRVVASETPYIDTRTN